MLSLVFVAYCAGSATGAQIFQSVSKSHQFRLFKWTRLITVPIGWRPSLHSSHCDYWLSLRCRIGTNGHLENLLLHSEHEEEQSARGRRYQRGGALETWCYQCRTWNDWSKWVIFLFATLTEQKANATSLHSESSFPLRAVNCLTQMAILYGELANFYSPLALVYMGGFHEKVSNCFSLHIPT